MVSAIVALIRKLKKETSPENQKKNIRARNIHNNFFVIKNLQKNTNKKMSTTYE